MKTAFIHLFRSMQYDAVWLILLNVMHDKASRNCPHVTGESRQVKTQR